MVHRFVPMFLSPQPPPTGGATGLSPLIALQATLLSEELGVHRASCEEGLGGPLAAVQAAGVLQCSVCKLAESALLPMIGALRYRLGQCAVQERLAQLLDASLQPPAAEPEGGGSAEKDALVVI